MSKKTYLIILIAINYLRSIEILQDDYKIQNYTKLQNSPQILNLENKNQQKFYKQNQQKFKIEPSLNIEDNNYLKKLFYTIQNENVISKKLSEQNPLFNSEC